VRNQTKNNRRNNRQKFRKRLELKRGREEREIEIRRIALARQGEIFGGDNQANRRKSQRKKKKLRRKESISRLRGGPVGEGGRKKRKRRRVGKILERALGRTWQTKEEPEQGDGPAGGEPREGNNKEGGKRFEGKKGGTHEKRESGSDWEGEGAKGQWGKEVRDM